MFTCVWQVPFQRISVAWWPFVLVITFSCCSQVVIFSKTYCPFCKVSWASVPLHCTVQARAKVFAVALRDFDKISRRRFSSQKAKQALFGLVPESSVAVVEVSTCGIPELSTLLNLYAKQLYPNLKSRTSFELGLLCSWTFETMEMLSKMPYLV